MIVNLSFEKKVMKVKVKFVVGESGSDEIGDGDWKMSNEKY